MYTIVAHTGHGVTRIQADAGESLLSALQRGGVTVPAPCGGHGTCGKCRVKVLSGDAGEITAEEKRLLAGEMEKGWRLACRCAVTGDITLEVPASDVDARVLVDGGMGEIDLCPASRRAVLPADPPSLADQRSDAERVREAAGAESVAFSALPQMSRAAREGAAVFLFRGAVMSAEGDTARNLGVAVDVGTTTMAAYLTDLDSGETLEKASCLNPQRAHGGDVISRADYAAQSGENLMALRRQVTGAIEDMTGRMLDKAGLGMKDVRHVVAVGNTIMMHLLLGLDPRHIAASPFAPVYTRSVDVPAGALGMTLPRAMVTPGPCVAGYVGADTVAAILSCDMDRSPDIHLMIDIGTNGEIALGGQGGIVCCSAAAGPAFEGAHIHCGSGAALGAVDSVKIHDGQVDITTIGGAAPATICGSGLVDAVAEMLKEEIIDETGRLDEDEIPDEYADRLIEVDGKPAFSLDGRGEEGVFITQKDLREVQLAKAAIAAGIEVLMESMGIRYGQVKSLYLAGGFGNYIRRESAVEIGLLPSQMRDKIVPVGNAAGSGARRMLLSRRDEERAARIAADAKYIELSARPDFQDKFVENMMFE